VIKISSSIFSTTTKKLPLCTVYLIVSHPFTQVYEMADWKTFLIIHSCAQAKKRNHTGETKSWSPAGGPIYSSKGTNSRFQAGGPLCISKEENIRLKAGGSVCSLREGDIQPLATLPTYGSRERLFCWLSGPLPVTLFQFIILYLPTICHLQAEELRVGLNIAQKPQPDTFGA